MRKTITFTLYFIEEKAKQSIRTVADLYEKNWHINGPGYSVGHHLEITTLKAWPMTSLLKIRKQNIWHLSGVLSSVNHGLSSR